MMERIMLSFNNIIFYSLILTVLLDVFLGSIRAIKYKEWNSTFGINGILRKVSMIGSSIFLIALDSFLNIDLLFFIPDSILSVVKMNSIGIFDLFGIMFILYEVTSIFKNMLLCGLPVPNKIKNIIEKVLVELTNEVDIETPDEKN